MQVPWTLLLNQGGQDLFIVASTAELPNVSYRTTDREVQEDAFRLTVKDATEAAGIKIAAKSFFREDLSNELLKKSAISFLVKTESELTGTVALNMSCESEGDAPGSCRGTVDLTEQFKAQPQGEYQRVTVDLQCFANQGVDFSGLVIPFNLVATGSATMSVSDIKFEFDAADSATVSCQ
jgi:beta-glucosidase